MHRLHQDAHALWWRELADAMAEVENMRRAGGVGVCVGRPKTVKYSVYLLFNRSGWGKQNMRV
jgi:hypothetical protein